jgi:hypothetical protein
MKTKKNQIYKQLITETCNQKIHPPNKGMIQANQEKVKARDLWDSI